MLPLDTSIDATRQQINVIPMNFRKEHLPDPKRPGEFREVVMVDLVKKGTNGESTPYSIKQLQGQQALWEYVEPSYNRWLKGQEDPVDGTPLDVVAFLTKGQIDKLRMLNILSVEDLAQANEGAQQRIGMGARAMVAKAKAFVENRTGDGKLATINERLTVENEQLQAQIDELRAQIELLSDDKPQRKKTA